MKKILLLLAVLLVTVVLLPVIGNNVVQKTINSAKDDLESYGLELVKKDMQTNYFNTELVYEIKLTDTNKFISYLNSISNTNIPVSNDNVLNGLAITTNVKYSNFPLSNTVCIDTHLNSLPTLIMQDLTLKDKEFHAYLSKLLKDKKVLYHINYNVSDKKFDGYLQDINEEYITKELTKVNVTINGSKFKGEGNLFSPKAISSNTNTVLFAISEKNDDFKFEFKNISGNTKYTSKDVYASNVDINEFNFNFKDDRKNFFNIDTKNIKLHASSDINKDKIDVHTNTSFKNINIENKEHKFSASDFHYDISVLNLDKKLLDELKTLVSQANTNKSKALSKRIGETAINLVSKGLILSVKDLSVKKLSILNQKDMDGFKFNAEVKLKETPNLMQKLNANPHQLMQNIKVDSNFKISQILFDFTSRYYPAVMMAKGFAKEDGSNLTFAIKFDKSQLTINGKAIK